MMNVFDLRAKRWRNGRMHYDLDLWYKRRLKCAMEGESRYVRFADDFVMLFQYKRDIEESMAMLVERLAKFGIQVAGDKMRILPFGRFNGSKEGSDFLGFKFIDPKTHAGKYHPGIRASTCMLNATIANIVPAVIPKRSANPNGMSTTHAIGC